MDFSTMKDLTVMTGLTRISSLSPHTRQEGWGGKTKDYKVEILALGDKMTINVEMLVEL